jgi:hypothetical protein
MKKNIIIILLLLLSVSAYTETTFDTFCGKFLQLSLPLYANISEATDTKELYYFQLGKESPITEEEFNKYIKTSRWGEFQQPTDSLLHIYHYVPAGRFDYGQYIVLIVNCGYMPEPMKYEDSDIGAYENMLCVYTQDGLRIDSVILSKSTCVSNKDGKFAAEWKASMPMMHDKAAISANGEIIIKHFKDNELTPYGIDTLQIEEHSGKIIKQ